MRCRNRSALFAVLLIVAGRALGADTSADASAIDTIDAWLLTSGDAARIKLAAKNIVAEPARPTVTFDLVASVLNRYVDDEKALDEDTASWLLRALGASRSLRYREIVERARRKGGKVARYANDAANELTTEAPAWTRDAVDPARMRAELLQQKRQRPAPSNAAFADIRSGVALETMWPTLWLPDDIATTMSNSYLHEWAYRLPNANSPYWSTGNAVTQMVFTYEKLGRVVLDRYGSGWVVSTTSATSGAINVSDSSTLLLQQFGGELRSSDPKIVRQAARRMLDLLIDDEAVLADAGKVVVDNLATEDDEMIDAMSLLCRALGQSSNAETQNILRRVSKEAKSRKLRRWSQDIYERMNERNR